MLMILDMLFRSSLGCRRRSWPPVTLHASGRNTQLGRRGYTDCSNFSTANNFSYENQDHICPVIKVNHIETATQVYNLDPDDAYYNSPWWKRIPDKWEPRMKLTRNPWLVAHETLEAFKLPNHSKLLRYWGELEMLRRRFTGAVQRGATSIVRHSVAASVQVGHWFL